MKLNQGRTFGTRSGGVLNFSVEEHFLSIDLSVYLLQVIQSHWRLLSRWPSNGLRLTRLHHYNRMVRKNTHFGIRFSSVQSLSRVQLFATPWTAACQASLSITKSQSPPKPMSIELVMPSNHLILCHPLILLPSIFPSIRFFSNESAFQMRWPKYWSFSFNINPSSEHPGLISFRMEWLDLLAVQGTLKSLLQHHSSKASPFC